MFGIVSGIAHTVCRAVNAKRLAAIVFVFFLLGIWASCHNQKSLGAEDCSTILVRLDSLIVGRQLDSVLALGELALSDCVVNATSADSLSLEIYRRLVIVARTGARYSELFRFAERLRTITFVQRGPDDPLTAVASVDLGEGCYRVGDFTRAESLLINARSVFVVFPDQYTESHLRCLKTLARLELELTRVDLADEAASAQRSLAERAFGREAPAVASAMADQALVLKNQLRYREAETMCEQAIRMLDRMTSADSCYVDLLLTMGDLYRIQSRYAEAEALFARATAILTSLYGSTHELVSTPYHYMAELMTEQGKYTEAEDYFLKALSIRRTQLGPRHPGIPRTLEALAMLYFDRGRFEEAEPLLKEAARIFTSIGGPYNSGLSTSLNRLAMVKLASGDLPEAERFADSGLAIRTRRQMEDHLVMSYSLATFAQIRMAQGRFAESSSLILRARNIAERYLSPANPAVLDLVRQYAICKVKGGRMQDGLAAFQELVILRSQFMRHVFSFASEARKLRWISRYPLLDDALLSEAILRDSDPWATVAYDMLLRGKCAVADAVSAEREKAHCSNDPAVERLLTQRSQVYERMAECALGQTSDQARMSNLDTLNYLSAMQDSLDEALSHACGAFGSTSTDAPLGTDSVVRMLPAEVVLWDYVRYRPFDFAHPFRQTEGKSPARYLAFSLDHDGHRKIIDLGSASRIDTLVITIRQMLEDARPALYDADRGRIAEERLQLVTRELYELVVAPLVGTLDDRTVIYVCPDGSLNLVPFDMLADPEGRYLAEKYQISYLTTPRDLIFTSVSGDSVPKTALIFADPDFDLVQSNTGGNAIQERRAESRTDMAFSRLPGSAREGEAVEAVLRGHSTLQVETFLNDRATEDCLDRMAPSACILHLATHGFYFADTIKSGTTVARNPLLRSGLALVGANLHLSQLNRSGRNEEDGVITGLEISALDLKQTELTVLSSCESGLGEIVDGEGVFGLRRAFRQAGCHTLISSFWTIPDQETIAIMTDFYTAWMSGKSKGEALRIAALRQLSETRRTRGHGHPLLWCSFGLSGDPR